MANWKRYRAVTYKVERQVHRPSGRVHFHWTAVQGSRRLTGDATTEADADRGARVAIDALQGH